MLEFRCSFVGISPNHFPLSFLIESKKKGMFNNWKKIGHVKKTDKINTPMLALNHYLNEKYGIRVEEKFSYVEINIK